MSRTSASEKGQTLIHQGGLLTLLTAVAGVIPIACLLLLVQTSRVATTGYDIRRLENIRDDWKQKNYQVEAEIATLQSLDYIEKQAATKLKMVRPTNYVYIEVKQTPRATVAQNMLPSNKGQKGSETQESPGWWQQISNLARFWEARERGS